MISADASFAERATRRVATLSPGAANIPVHNTIDNIAVAMLCRSMTPSAASAPQVTNPRKIGAGGTDAWSTSSTLSSIRLQQTAAGYPSRPFTDSTYREGQDERYS